jgi:hypothetical protein
MLETGRVRAGLVGAVLGTIMAATGTALAAGGSLVGKQPFVNGGITSDEADVMRQEATHYPLEITLARRGETPGYNDFVAGAQLRVVDSAGRVVVDRSDAGPIFLADLPPGSYTIEATYSGHTKTDHVQVSEAGRTQVTLVWQ